MALTDGQGERLPVRSNREALERATRGEPGSQVAEAVKAVQEAVARRKTLLFVRNSKQRVRGGEESAKEIDALYDAAERDLVDKKAILTALRNNPDNFLPPREPLPIQQGK